MDRAEFMRQLHGRKIYYALLDAIRDGATASDIREVTLDAVRRAVGAADEAGIKLPKGD